MSSGAQQPVTPYNDVGGDATMSCRFAK